jgi:cytochrome c553
MTDVAKNLKEDDIAALAIFFSSRESGGPD